MNWLRSLFGSGTVRREAAGAAPLAPPPAPAPAPPVIMASVLPGEGAFGRPPFPSEAELAALLARLKAVDPAGWALHIAPACRRWSINTPARLAPFVGTVMHESGKLARLVESMNYSVEGLLSNFGRHRISRLQAAQLGRTATQPANQKAIALQLYGGAFGWNELGNLPGTDDGWELRGHGLIQLTGRYNFKRFGDIIGRTVEELPAILRTREGAAESAAHFWAAAGCNELADAGDIRAIREVVNGPKALGLAEVRVITTTALAVLGEAPSGTATA